MAGTVTAEEGPFCRDLSVRITNQEVGDPIGGLGIPDDFLILFDRLALGALG